MGHVRQGKTLANILSPEINKNNFPKKIYSAFILKSNFLGTVNVQFSFVSLNFYFAW